MIDMDIMEQVALTEEEAKELKHIIPQYAFYEKKRSSVHWYCSCCEKWYEERYDADDLYYEPIPRHNFYQNGFIKCRCCNSSLQVKCIGRGFKTLEDKGCYVICRNESGNFRLLVTRIRQQFLPDCTPILGVDVRFLYQFDKNNILHKWSWKYVGAHLNGGWGWSENKSVTTIPHDSYISNYGYDNAGVINPLTIQQTAQRYSGVENILFGRYNARDFIEYLIQWSKHPQIEYIAKQKFYFVIDALLIHSGDIRVNWKSNNLLKMIGIRSKADIEACKKMSMEQFRLYRDLSGKYSDMAQIALALPSSDCQYIRLLCERTNLTPKKVTGYLIKQKVSGHYWLDYLNMAQKAYTEGYELMPRDIKTAHDRCVNIINALKRTLIESFTKVRNKSLEKFIYEENGLKIVLPGSVEDIVNEGKALCHCVAGYADRHFKGETTIVFLRKTDAIDKPYYTIELDKLGQIKQCYGYRNNYANNPKPDSIKEFEKHYEIYLQTEVLKHVKRVKPAIQASA